MKTFEEIEKNRRLMKNLEKFLRLRHKRDIELIEDIRCGVTFKLDGEITLECLPVDVEEIADLVEDYMKNEDYYNSL